MNRDILIQMSVLLQLHLHLVTENQAGRVSREVVDMVLAWILTAGEGEPPIPLTEAEAKCFTYYARHILTRDARRETAWRESGGAAVDIEPRDEIAKGASL